MEEILHHLRCTKPCKLWDNLSINWCRISSINSITGHVEESEKKTVGKFWGVGTTHVKFRGG